MEYEGKPGKVRSTDGTKAVWIDAPGVAISRLPDPERFDAKAGELARRIHDLIHEYDGEISQAAAVGALEIVKHQLIQG